MNDLLEKDLVRPFPALRPVPDLAQEVVAPPYDVVSTSEAAALAKNKPWSFLHISKPEIDLPLGTDTQSDKVYDKARENFNKMINDGILRRDTEEYYYIYRLKMGDHTQTGIVVAGSIEAYKKNFIRRHEYTRSDKETDRVRQIDAVNAQTGPVLTIHKSNNLLERVIERTVCYDADYHVIGVGKVEHTLWVVRDAFDIKEITRAFEKIGVIYIADGHHRSAAACRVSESRNKSAKSLSGDRLHNFFLIVSFPESEVKIYEYNRVVKDLNGFSESQFIRKINETFDVEKQTQATRPNARNNFSMYLSGNWYSLSVKEPVPTSASAVDQLDVSILSDRLMEPILGIRDPRTDPRIDFVGGIRGMTELEKRVESGDWAVAFSLYPTSIQDLISVADAKEVMPPKSTWFEPKLADGMISLVFE